MKQGATMDSIVIFIIDFVFIHVLTDYCQEEVVGQEDFLFGYLILIC